MNDTKKQLYEEWVGKVIDFLNDVGPKVQTTCSVMQSRPELCKDVEVVFLGCNANEPGGFYVDKERFYNGNPSFYKERNEWKIWTKPYYAFKSESINNTSLMEDGNFIFMNAFFFGTNKLAELDALTDIKTYKAQCLEYVKEAIQTIFKPKMIVCFSIPSCFDALNKQFHFENVERIHPKYPKLDGQSRKIMKIGYWNGIKVMGIPHPSQRISWDDMGAVCNQILIEYGK